MRVLHYVDENDLSWGRSWIALLSALNDEGIENYVLCRPGGTLSKSLSDKKIICKEYKPILPAFPQTALGISSVLDEIKPDIIHTRLSSAAKIGGWWGKRKNIPVISTIDKHAKLKYYNDSALLLPCSKAVAEHLKRQGCTAEKLHVVYNPIDVAFHKVDIAKRESFRREHSISSDTKIIVSAGRFDDGKGFETLISAYAVALKNGGFKCDTKLWLLGDGTHRKSMESLINDYEIDENVLMPGFVSDVREWFWTSDIFVSPSEIPEGFSVALLEAMACGLPAVSTDIGGSPEIVFDRSNGRLFSPGDKDRLSSILKELINDNEILMSYAEAAAKSAERFDLKIIANETVRIYDNLLNNRG